MKRRVHVLSTQIVIGQFSCPFHFSFDADRLQALLKKKYKVNWHAEPEKYDGETMSTEITGGAKTYVAMWVSRENHKTATEAVLTVLHEIDHVARKVLDLYGEEVTAEETCIRVADGIREKVFKFLHLNIYIPGYGGDREADEAKRKE